ncbi:hypothetical protein BP00DRAFT_459597 [Aspergillus indologenus CBS 114.80]|uniref:Uncharacterized protein n=1 Tax=Aspergillus indologenus CBS 114.80 TaxID=1450541 RepID=A0A2V5HZT6_9EURO|nr:hypothetical protein BP00DRAFT_459597 [Aspergillus indologenus CBS 114.80]
MSTAPNCYDSQGNPAFPQNMSISSRPGPGPEQTYISPGVSSKPATTTTIKDYPTLEVTEISLSPCMDAHALENSSSSSSSIAAPPQRRRTPSPSSPAATTKTTSTSSSSSSSSTSRHRKSSLRSRHSSSHYSQHRRTATAVSITPITDQTTRREDLLALHRESCRLFQQQPQEEQQQTPPLTPRNQRSPSTSTRSNVTTTLSNTNTNTNTNTKTRNGDKYSPISIHEVHKTPVRASTLPVWDYTDEVPTTTPKTTVTVIDWTSPSTRRREYEKIDKASSGMRGFWRRVAPKWCQSRARRMPFFEEKDGKGNYEGSVRRFRMDLPE